MEIAKSAKLQVTPEEKLEVGISKAQFDHNPSGLEISGRIYAKSPTWALRGLPRIPVRRAKGSVLENDVPTAR